MTNQPSGRDQYISDVTPAPATPGPTVAPHGMDGTSAPGVPGPDGDVLGNLAPARGTPTSTSEVPGSYLGAPNISEPNLGLQRPAMPEMEFNGGEGLSPSDFNRAPLTAGHARLSPGDGPQDGGLGHRSFYSDASKEASPDNEAEMDASELGPGVLPTPRMNIETTPARASDFARGDIGTANSSGVVRRAPLSADDPMFQGGRDRGDNLQSDGQPSALAGNPFPETAGREGNPNGDMAQHQVVKPQIDVSPSLGADATGIAKHQIHKEETR